METLGQLSISKEDLIKEIEYIIGELSSIEDARNF